MSFTTPNFELEREFSILYSGDIPSNTFIFLINTGDRSANNVILKLLEGDEEGVFGEEAVLGNVEKNAILKIPVKQTLLMDKAYQAIPKEGSGLYAVLYFNDSTGAHYAQAIHFTIREDRGVKFGYTSLLLKLGKVRVLKE